jgi:hypothetical protein
MKTYALVFSFLITVSLFAQNNSIDNCQDIVYLKDGSKLTGKITEMNIGEYLFITTVTGLSVKVESKYIKKINQNCDKTKVESNQPLLNKGYYGGIRFLAFQGKTYYKEFALGLGGQVHIGYRFRPEIGIGLSFGGENMLYNNNDEVSSFPLLVEASGKIFNKNSAPSYNIGVGYGFVSKGDNLSDIQYRKINDIKGGMAYQGILGFRLSDKFKLNIGARIQHKKLYWQPIWSDQTNTNYDKIVNKRLLIGIEYIW